MMTELSFPHPVLGHDDDLTGALSPLQLKVESDVNRVVLSIPELTVSNPTLRELIRQRFAVFAVRVQCNSTYFRETWHTHESRILLEVPASRLANRVEVSVRIVSSVELPHYKPEGIHPDYGDAAFSINQGDVLALGETMAFMADKDFDPLAGAVNSFMRVEKGHFNTGPFTTDFDGDLVFIRVAGLDYDNYLQLRSHAPQVLHSALVLPVLMEAIALVRTREDFANLKWAQHLRTMMDANEILAETPLLDAAQAILRSPFSRTCAEARIFDED
ncbi:hypothetical protein [Myxococcus landrumensis]|uniref:Uncharacterized protein n=1 Tax=Myxococcus landrumensis TaxID=2813577 RepID=A0ABX7MYE2_9BACT|nr:hypothetical protein [Myxococcus landrumus]QSQ11214.1 hypothetical protein JY572_22615 [Myxococcus landrumus]